MSISKSHKKAAPRAHTPDTSSKSGSLHTVTSALFGTVIGFSAALILSASVAFLCFLSGDPNAYVLAAALSVLYLSSFISGFAAVKKNRSSALLCGSLSGIFLMLLFMLCSFFFNSDANATFQFPFSVFLRAAMIAASVLGGYLGAKKGNNKKRSHQHRR